MNTHVKNFRPQLCLIRWVLFRLPFLYQMHLFSNIRKAPRYKNWANIVEITNKMYLNANSNVYISNLHTSNQTNKTKKNNNAASSFSMQWIHLKSAKQLMNHYFV